MRQLWKNNEESDPTEGGINVEPKVRQIFEETIEKWEEIYKGVIKIYGPITEICPLCVGVKNCDECIAQPICNGQQDGKYNGKNTIYTKAVRAYERFLKSTEKGLEELRKLRPKDAEISQRQT